MTSQQYLGNGIYVRPATGNGLMLTTDSGMSVDLPADVAARLVSYVARAQLSPEGRLQTLKHLSDTINAFKANGKS